jgi:5-hydroxyisourate hydrolase
MSRISTHVLDTALGLPAAGVVVHLEFKGRSLAVQKTDQDGRCANLLPSDAMEPGEYRLRFETGEYHTRQSVNGLYPVVEITVTVRPGVTHLHVPLLLSPNGYTTYRGS